jgi:catechol 2,3-dioxygenase
VRLRVSDLDRSVSYYESILGMRPIVRDAAHASLGAHGDDRVLLELDEHKDARSAARRGRLGLFHFAILLPDRGSLGQFVRHLDEERVHAGAGDHLVSEAFYLQDPDDLGSEVYADRPRATWRRVGRELMISTDPVDVGAVVQAAGDARWTGMPAGTVMGHVHLHVGDIQRAFAFFSEALGFDRMAWSYPGALFMGAGGYHHHLGTNTWAGPGARPTQPDEAGLIEWTIEVPDGRSVDAAAASLAGAGFDATRDASGLSTRDPWGTAIRLAAAKAE